MQSCYLHFTVPHTSTTKGVLTLAYAMLTLSEWMVHFYRANTTSREKSRAFPLIQEGEIHSCVEADQTAQTSRVTRHRRKSERRTHADALLNKESTLVWVWFEICFYSARHKHFNKTKEPCVVRRLWTAGERKHVVDGPAVQRSEKNTASSPSLINCLN